MLLPNVKFVLKAEGTPDPRRHNTPINSNDTTVLIVGNGNNEEDVGCISRDIVLPLQNGDHSGQVDEKQLR